MGRTTVAAIVGGTISRITGGKFANGAVTAAMAQLFNNETSAARARGMQNEYSVDGKLVAEINSGSAANIASIEEDLKDIFSTPRGKEMLIVIQKGGKPVIIRINNSGKLSARTGKLIINLDPSRHPVIQTTSGPIPAGTRRILAHELGHAVMGTRDVGPGRMDNIHLNENPIMTSLGEPARTRY